MGVLFTGLGLLTAVIVFQMYRFSISGFTATPDGTGKTADKPATSAAETPGWLKSDAFKYTFIGLGILILVVSGIAMIITRRSGN